MVAGPQFKVAGPALGLEMFEQMVCQNCHDSFHEYMDNNFWKEADCSCKDNCPKCSDGLTSQNVRPVHKKHNKDGTAHMATVCNCCYALYVKACQSAIEKRKGETNG